MECGDEPTFVTFGVYTLLSILITVAVITPLQISAATPTANTVFINGREWRQPLDTVNLSYYQVATKCCVKTGLCDGSVKNTVGQQVDLSGWTWASHADIADLFEFLTGAPDSTFDDPDGPTMYDCNNEECSWIFDAIDNDRDGQDVGLFHETTNSDHDHDGVFGITRSVLLNNAGVSKANRSYIAYYFSEETERALTANVIDFDAPRAVNGIWFYKEVPKPPNGC